jgi:MoaA/NifB/PqqE/SkfB family radical SAM enzyme
VRRADLKTGYDCNSNCVFCVIGDKLFTGNRPFAECVEELRLSRATCDDVVFTGAEVTIRPDFFALVAAARKLGYRNIQIQTNGRMFAYLDFCKKAIAAGANEFSPSIHGHTARLHDGLTRAPGSFDQIVGAIRNLRSLGQRVVTNTVATKQNQRHLPALARLLVELEVTQFQIAFPHPTGHAHTYFRGVIPRMSTLAPFVTEALAIGREAGVGCMAEAIPYCLLPGWERFVAELFIPPTEIVYDGFVVPDYKRDRMERGKTRFPQCAGCRFEPMCEGPWREYPDELGSDEFRPVSGPRVLDTAVVLDDRFDMLGQPAPQVPDHSARWLALVFVPEPGTQECDLQLHSVASDLLPNAGIGVVTISPAPGASLHDRDGSLCRAYRVAAGGRFRRTTFLLGPERRVDHILVSPDVPRHAAQILDGVRRFEAPPRPLERGEELVLLRHTRKPAAEVASELRLTPDHHEFSD